VVHDVCDGHVSFIDICASQKFYNIFDWTVKMWKLLIRRV